MEILKVQNLTKKYGKKDTEVVALDNVSFSVEKGEFIAIVGASGSGKSTLLHLMGGVDKPTSGKVFINDKDIYQLSKDDLAIFRRREIGIIIENNDKVEQFAKSQTLGYAYLENSKNEYKPYVFLEAFDETALYLGFQLD